MHKCMTAFLAMINVCIGRQACSGVCRVTRDWATDRAVSKAVGASCCRCAGLHADT